AAEDWWLAWKPADRAAPLNIDACRIDGPGWSRQDGDSGAGFKAGKFMGTAGLGEATQKGGSRSSASGRWPANLVLDEDVAAELDARVGPRKSGKAGSDGHRRNRRPAGGIYGGGKGLWQDEGPAGNLYGDSGGVSRYYYSSKAPRGQRWF